MADTIGRRPTPQESGLVSAAAALAPEKTLARLDEFGKYAVLLDDFTYADVAGNAKIALNVSQIQSGISSVSISSTEERCSLPVTLSVGGTTP